MEQQQSNINNNESNTINSQEGTQEAGEALDYLIIEPKSILPMRPMLNRRFWTTGN